MMIDSTMSTFDEAIDNHTENDDDCIVEKLQSSSLSSTKMAVNNTNNTNNHNHNNHHHPTINSNENPGLFKLNQLAENWLELESDPGLFTLLIKDFGCSGVEVEEIYDLQSSFDNMDHVYGFIFLFNVIEERRNRCSQRNSIVTVNATASTSTLSTTTSTTTINLNGLNYQSPSCLLSGNFIDDPKFLNEMFFAHQKVPNSCATHAILSILLNCSQYLDIGPMLKRLKEYTTDMTPEDKGLAISNLAELAKAHNSHATHMYMVNEREQHHHHTTSNAIRISQRNTNSTMEAFHFVSFVPINGRLIELDGLKERPIDHGLIDPLKESWMEKFRRLVRQRIETSAETTVAGDIRYNLMAVIPNKYDCRQRLLNTMEFNRSSLLKTIHQMEYHRSIQMRYEHNYSNIDYQNFNDIVDCSTTFLPEDPLNSQIKLTANSLIFDDNQQSSIMETCDDNDNDDDGGTSTDTASEASSSYNFSPHNTHQNDDDDDNGEKCTKFFICKFDKNNDHNNPAFDSDDDDYSTATTTTSDDEKNLDEISAEIIEDILKKIIDTTDDSFESDSENDDNDHSCKINNRKYRKKKNLKRKFLIKTRKKKRKNFHNNNEEEMKLIESIIKEIGLNSQTLSPTSSPSVETQTTVKQSTKSSTILQDIVHLIETLNHRILRCQHECVEEKHKLERYAIDVNRRTHDYDNLIQTFLSMLSDQGLLDDLLGYHHNDNNDNNNDEWSSNSINYESSSISTTDLIPSPFDLDSIRNSEIHSTTTTTNFSNHHNDNNNDNTIDNNTSTMMDNYIDHYDQLDQCIVYDDDVDQSFVVEHHQNFNDIVDDIDDYDDIQQQQQQKSLQINNDRFIDMNGGTIIENSSPNNKNEDDNIDDDDDDVEDEDDEDDDDNDNNDDDVDEDSNDGDYYDDDDNVIDDNGGGGDNGVVIDDDDIVVVGDDNNNEDNINENILQEYQLINGIFPNDFHYMEMFNQRHNINNNNNNNFRQFAIVQNASNSDNDDLMEFDNSVI